MDQEGKVIHRLFGKWHEGVYCGVPPSAKCIWRPGKNQFSLTLTAGLHSGLAVQSFKAKRGLCWLSSPRLHAHRLWALLRLHQVCHWTKWALSWVKRCLAADGCQIQTWSKVQHHICTWHYELLTLHIFAATEEKKCDWFLPVWLQFHWSQSAGSSFSHHVYKFSSFHLGIWKKVTWKWRHQRSSVLRTCRGSGGSGTRRTTSNTSHASLSKNAQSSSQMCIIHLVECITLFFYFVSCSVLSFIGFDWLHSEMRKISGLIKYIRMKKISYFGRIRVKREEAAMRLIWLGSSCSLARPCLILLR